MCNFEQGISQLSLRVLMWKRIWEEGTKRIKQGALGKLGHALENWFSLLKMQLFDFEKSVLHPSRKQSKESEKLNENHPCGRCCSLEQMEIIIENGSANDDDVHICRPKKLDDVLMDHHQSKSRFPSCGCFFCCHRDNVQCQRCWKTTLAKGETKDNPDVQDSKLHHVSYGTPLAILRRMGASHQQSSNELA